jgi:hypothetical protein
MIFKGQGWRDEEKKAAFKAPWEQFNGKNRAIEIGLY